MDAFPDEVGERGTGEPVHFWVKKEFWGAHEDFSRNGDGGLVRQFVLNIVFS